MGLGDAAINIGQPLLFYKLQSSREQEEIKMESEE